MTTNHMKPVKAWAFKDLVGDVFASTNKEEVGCAFHHSGSPSEVRPVTIQSAEWLTREAFEAQYKGYNQRLKCWIRFVEGGEEYIEIAAITATADQRVPFLCLIFRGFSFAVSAINFQAITHLIPIHAPEAPIGE